MITSPFNLCSLRQEVTKLFQNAITMAVDCQSVEDVIGVIDKIIEISWREDELIRVLAYLSRYLPRNILMHMDNVSEIKVVNVRVNNSQINLSYVYKYEPFRVIVSSLWLNDLSLFVSILMLLSQYADSVFLDGEAFVHRLCYGVPLYCESDVYEVMMNLARELPSFVLT